MNTRYYDDHGLRNAAAQIAQEVILAGRSTGWCGRTLEDLHAVEETLKPFNVVYVDDMNGTWARRDD
jgi:hypothetical protein